MGKYLRRFSLLLLLGLSCSNLSLAQEVEASITGNVTDASGAVIPGATVEITNVATKGNARTLQTDRSGSYTATNLAPGTYTVTVSAPGFKAFKAQNVTVFVAQKRTVDAPLQTGAVNETVSVQATAVAIETSSSAQAGTVSGTQVRELELSNRNFEQLVTLQPGVVSGLGDETGFGLNNTSTVAVNGARSTANNWSVDGADINDSGSNSTLLNVPSVDSIQEFTLERGTYDASYGRSAGAQVLVATKQGTSQYHGDAYEFVRNNILNANTYFGNQTDTPRGVERYNNFGFTLGGPLWIPKVYNRGKDKTFFFWSEEWRKVSSPTTNSVTAPTTAQLNGIVAGDITASAPAGCVTYNAASQQSTINPSCYSQNAKVYLANVFDKFAANSGGNNVTTFSSLNNVRQDIIRIDHNFTDKIHFFGRAIQDETPENFPTGLFAAANYPNLVNTAVNAPGENVVGNLTYTITPNLVNEAEFAYSQGTIAATLSGVANSPTVAASLTNNTAYVDPYGRIPSISFTGGTITGLAQGSAPYHERNLDRTFFDNLSLTHGKHTFRVGISVSQLLKTENASEGNASFNFNTWQDFLLGNTSIYTQSSRDIIPDLHYFNVEAYGQDDWKVTPRLTLNLGLRWSYFPSPTDSSNTLNNFLPSLYNPSLAPVIDANGNFVSGTGLPATYTNGIIFPAGTACNEAKAISPGVTCSPFGARVNPNSNKNFGPRAGFAYAPTRDGKLSIRGGFGIFFDRSLNGIWEDNAFTDPPLVQTSTVNNTSFDHPLAGAQAASLAPNRLELTGSPSFKVPSYASYNLSLQQQILQNTIFEIAYVGTAGRQLLGEVDLNQPTLSARAANPTADVNAVRPFLGYSYFKARTPGFTDNYNSLQVSLNRRVANGLTIGIAYTWSRNLTTQSNDRDTATTDTYNPRLDYGPSSLNTPQIFIANYIYQLPFYTAQHGFTGHVLGGWEVSGITSVETGQSATVTQAVDPFACIAPANNPNGCIAGTYPGGLGISSPNGSIAPRADQIAPVSRPKQLNQFFSTSSFSQAVGHFGTSSNGSFVGPGFQNWDLGAIKNVQIGERYKFQLRGEFFNAFNHTNYSGVDSNLNDANFGQVTSTHLPRRIQIGAKVYF